MKNAAYYENILGSDSNGQSHSEYLSQAVEVEKDIKKLAKKADKGKIGRKKFKKKLKKLDRLNSAMVYQGRGSRSYSWWQQTLVDSAPKALELVAVTLTQKEGQRRKQTCVND